MIERQTNWCTPGDVAAVLASHHYLGAVRRGVAWRDEHGVIVLGAPTARGVPRRWLELSRWCITDRLTENAGSRQWAAMVRSLRKLRPDVTTVVSYSDPNAGHTGALYRACNWLWAPTWHRLRPPPSGNGSWSCGRAQGVKDRWVFLLRADPERESLLIAKDEAVLKRMPWARYREPGGADYKQWTRVGDLA